MKRTLLYITLPFCAGSFCGIYVKIKPFYLLLICLFLFFVSILLYARGRRVYCLLYFLVFFLGIYLACSRLYNLQSKTQMFLGKYITVEGQISGDVQNKGNMSNFVLYVDSIESDGIKYGCRCMVKVVDYKNKPGYIIPFNSIALSGKFQLQDIYKNTNSFSYKDSLLRKGISGVLDADYVTGIKSYKLNRRPLSRFIYGIKSYFEGIYDRYLDKNSSGMMDGVIFGDISGISDISYQNFKDSGVVHIFAVSGSNIWLLCGILSLIFSFLKHDGFLKNAIIVFILLVYTVMSGCSASVIRAFVMASAVLCGKMAGRRTDPVTSLSLAALVILIINPLSVGDTGFQLSFLCAFSIIMLYPKLKRIKIPVNSRIKEPLMITLSVQLGILPLIMYYFNSLPLYSLLANILVLPLISIFTIGGIVLVPLSLVWGGAASIAGKIINLLGSAIINFCGLVSNLPYSNIAFLSPGIIEIAIYYILLFMVLGLIRVGPRYKYILGSSVVILLLMYTYNAYMPGELRISFIDVGQGDCILITTPDRKHILIDGGGKPEGSYSKIDIGEDVLKPYLYRHGIKKIDTIVSTHGHEDHLNGLIPVIKSFETQMFIKTNKGDPKPYESLIKTGIIDKGCITNIEQGAVINAGKYVSLYVLSPSEKPDDENDSSIVLKLIYKDFTALFTGDVGADIEEKLCRFNLQSDVLKVAHHGSSRSVDEKFLEAVDPEASVICVGENNFGHPSQEALDSINKAGSRLYRTDIDGEVIITTRGKGFKVRTAVAN